MTRSTLSKSRRPSRHHAFTLLEIIIVLAIVAVLIGLCIPFISGMLKEARMREPVRELQDLARVMRSRAMIERVPYEISFNPSGFQGCKHILYTDDSDDTGSPPKTSGTASATPSTSGTSGTDDAVTRFEIIAEFTFPPGMTCKILYWGSSQWVEPSDHDDPDQCRWVFQPSGLCNPIRVQFHKGNDWIEVAFNPLTADIREERYSFSD